MPSRRFLDPKVYAAAIVVLVSALTHGATPAARRRLRALVGASRLTVTRWHRNMAGELLALAVQREARHIDEQLFLETYA